MPGLAQRNGSSSPCSVRSFSSNGIWSKHREDITFDQLQKFWNELSPHARQKLLRIDKQTLFEQARKNLYCSRCNGLLLEGFSQIVMYGKSLHHEGSGVHHPSKLGASNTISSMCQDDLHDPSVHPWGGLATTRDGILTLLDCFLDGKSLNALQNVFDSARARERERELLYPDACGGGGRGWISQGMANYGRGHGLRETCALHTARLSCDTLVDFWSALGDETRQSLLRMKEEDFIERLMYRFDSKRFCRDCRRNVIREFKELKELKRMRRELRCTSWFCVADTAFQYEVSHDMIQADWHQTFIDTVGTYHHFEWGVGTGEGKSDILEFEDVGLNGSVQVKGLELGGLGACFITLKAWKSDGRCTELTVKAHALKGQPCVHRRLVVGDGFVTIVKGESIRMFFEHAEEAEEEEDDDSMDKDGNELDGDGPRPQKHAKSPELAREFLLDAATVIFKEQVEKAFREGTARQNAHSIFVCLALKLLEDRVHVACKEIITLEKQIKLLEEEEKEKREEEERKERRRTKEREKKLRRKERLKGKERERDKRCPESKQLPIASQVFTAESPMSAHEEQHDTSNTGDLIIETGDVMLDSPISSDIIDERFSNGHINLKIQNLKNDNLRHPCNLDGELDLCYGNGSFMVEQSKSSRRKLRFRKDSPLDPASKWCDRRRSIISNGASVQFDESESKLHGYMESTARCSNGVHRQSRSNIGKVTLKSCGPKFGDKFHCSNNRVRDRYDSHSCSCNLYGDYRGKDGQHVSMIRSSRDTKAVNKSESVVDMSRPFFRNGKYIHGCYKPDGFGIPKGKLITGNIPSSREGINTKKVWEPMESRKKCPPSSSDPDIILRSSFKVAVHEGGRSEIDENGCQQTYNMLKSSEEQCSPEISGNSDKGDALNNYHPPEDNNKKSNEDCHNGFGLGLKSEYGAAAADEEVGMCPIISNFPMNNGSDTIMSTSSSDNCSSCLSEGDSSTGTSSTQNMESLSSDSEDASQQSEGREIACSESALDECPDAVADGKCVTNGQESSTRTTAGFPVASFVGSNHLVDQPTQNAPVFDNGRTTVDMGSQQHMLPMNNQMHLPVFPAPSTLGYYHQNAASWSAAPANGLVPFPQPNHYMFTSPLGYGLSATRSPPFCMQYGALQPVTAPVLNIGQLPMYQTANKPNVVNSKEQTKNSRVGGAKEAVSLADAKVSGPPSGRPCPNGRASTKEPSHGQDGSIGNPAKLHCDYATFSLFHYGGPIAVSAGQNVNTLSSKEETVRDSNSLTAPAQVDLACSKKETTIEEYSLFAASNGARFSFF